MVIRNRYIPFRHFAAINLFGVIFVRPEARVSAVLLNHERIHTAQMRELLFVGFYVWYVLEWIVLLLRHRSAMVAYRRVSFEREAYRHEHDLRYLSRRRHYSFLRSAKPYDL